MRNMNEQKPLFYTQMWKHLSPESMDEIKRHADQGAFSLDKENLAVQKAIEMTNKVQCVSKVKSV